MRAKHEESNGGKASRAQSQHPQRLLRSHRLFLTNIILLKMAARSNTGALILAFFWHIPCTHKVYVVDIGVLFFFPFLLVSIVFSKVLSSLSDGNFAVPLPQ